MSSQPCVGDRSRSRAGIRLSFNGRPDKMLMACLRCVLWITITKWTISRFLLFVNVAAGWFISSLKKPLSPRTPPPQETTNGFVPVNLTIPRFDVWLVENEENKYSRAFGGSSYLLPSPSPSGWRNPKPRSHETLVPSSHRESTFSSFAVRQSHPVAALPDCSHYSKCPKPGKLGLSCGAPGSRCPPSSGPTPLSPF